MFGCNVWSPLMRSRLNMGWSSPLPFTIVSFCMSRPFYLQTNWDFTAQSSFDANSLMDRCGFFFFFFVDEHHSVSDHPLTTWISLVGSGGTIFKTVCMISRGWSKNFLQNLDSQVLFRAGSLWRVFVFDFAIKQHTCQCVHTAWSDNSELGFPK